MVDGIGVLGAEYLIPFKMYAWINLLERKRAGEHVNEKDLNRCTTWRWRRYSGIDYDYFVDCMWCGTECLV